MRPGMGCAKMHEDCVVRRHCNVGQTHIARDISAKEQRHPTSSRCPIAGKTLHGKWTKSVAEALQCGSNGGQARREGRE
jgi:hypothetical protein